MKKTQLKNNSRQKNAQMDNDVLGDDETLKRITRSELNLFLGDRYKNTKYPPPQIKIMLLLKFWHLNNNIMLEPNNI